MKTIIRLAAAIFIAAFACVCVGAPAPSYIRNDVTTNAIGGPPNDNDVLTWSTGLNRPAWAVPPGATGGEANTASSAGGGAQLTAGKVGVNLLFNTLTNLDGTITIATNDPNQIVVSAASGMATDAEVAAAYQPLSSALATLDGIGAGASGDILYRDANRWTNLVKGSDGEVLKLTSGLPSWETDSTAAGGETAGTVHALNDNDLDTDNALVRVHGTVGTNAQKSVVLLGDTGALTAVNSVTATNNFETTAGTFIAGSTNIVSEIGGKTPNTFAGVTNALGIFTGSTTTYLRADGTMASPAGTGSMSTAAEGGSQVGGSDIATLDFGAGFDLTESPDTEINIALDLSEVATGGDLTWIGNTPSVAANAVALSTDTTGNYLATGAGTANEIEVSGGGSEGATLTIGLPDDVTIGDDLTVTGDATAATFTATGAGAGEVLVADADQSNYAGLKANATTTTDTILNLPAAPVAGVVTATVSESTNWVLTASTSAALGTPTATTPAEEDNSTKVATTAYVQTELADQQALSSVLTTLAGIGAGASGQVIWHDGTRWTNSTANPFQATNANLTGWAALATSAKEDALTDSASLRTTLSDESGTGIALFDGATLALNLASTMNTSVSNVINLDVATSYINVGGNVAYTHATNGTAGQYKTHVAIFPNYSGGAATLTIPSGWKTNLYSAVPAGLTNGWITKMYVSAHAATADSANQTNVTVSFEYYK